MAASGFTPISLYYSTTAAAAPTAGNLVSGELAINIADGKLWYKDSGGSVQLIASKAGASGDVVGPAGATANAAAIFDSTTGKLIKDSKVIITPVANSSTLTIANNKTVTVNNTLTLSGTDSTTMTFPSTSATIARTDAAQTFTGVQTFSSDASVNGITVGRGAGAGSVNTVVGAGALSGSNTGNANTAIGGSTLAGNTSGNYLTAVGYNAMPANTTGVENTAVGSGSATIYSSMRFNTTGSYNTAVGNGSLANNTTASYSTAIGYRAGYSYNRTSDTDGVNLFAGANSGYSVTTGNYNTFVGGINSGYYLTTGSKNTILGNYTGNQGGLDIRTASNYIVLSDGDGNPRQIIDSSGNLGLGVTPSLWGSIFRAQQIGTTASAFIAGRTDTISQVQLGVNQYYNGTNWVYTSANSLAATRYIQYNGAHSWHSSAAGTAGNTVSETQAMTLDASGYLLVGTTTSPSQQAVIYRTSATTSNGALLLDGNGNYAGLQFASSGTLYGSLAVDSSALYLTHGSTLTFKTGATTNVGGTERARITSGGDFVVARGTGGDTTVGVTAYSSGIITCARSSSVNADLNLYVYSTGAAAARFYVGMGGTVYATSTTITAISDQRLKENIRDLDAGLMEVMALKPRKFDWKSGKGKNKKNDRGWIAQEFEQVFPDMVDTWADPAPEGEEPYKAVNADLIPVLVKAIQEQQALITALTARVAALEGTQP